MTFIWQAAKEEIGKQQKKKGGQPREGIARCTFNDRIKMSDIVFFQAALPFVLSLRKYLQKGSTIVGGGCFKHY